MPSAVTIDKLPVEVFEQYAARRDLAEEQKVFGVGRYEVGVARDVQMVSDRQEVPQLAQLLGTDQKVTVAWFPKWKGERRDVRGATESLGRDEVLEGLDREWARVILEYRQDQAKVRCRQAGMQAA